MSDLPGNPYAMESRNPNITKETAAALALAYEQRTANLIAMWSRPQVTLQDMDGKPLTYSIQTDNVGVLLQQILERLGVDK